MLHILLFGVARWRQHLRRKSTTTDKGGGEGIACAIAAGERVAPGQQQAARTGHSARHHRLPRPPTDCWAGRELHQSRSALMARHPLGQKLLVHAQMRLSGWNAGERKLQAHVAYLLALVIHPFEQRRALQGPKQQLHVGRTVFRAMHTQAESVDKRYATCTRTTTVFVRLHVKFYDIGTAAKTEPTCAAAWRTCRARAARTFGSGTNCVVDWAGMCRFSIARKCKPFEQERVINAPAV